jgi:hypothetical protein
LDCALNNYLKKKYSSKDFFNNRTIFFITKDKANGGSVIIIIKPKNKKNEVPARETPAQNLDWFLLVLLYFAYFFNKKNIDKSHSETHRSIYLHFINRHDKWAKINFVFFKLKFIKFEYPSTKLLHYR